MGQKASCLADGPPFFQAVKDGRVEVIAELMCKNPALARHEVKESGVTVWHYAAEQGDIKVLKTLVEVMETIIVRHHEFKIDRSGVHQYIAILINQRNSDGQTPLMLACDAGSTKCCQYLLTKGATPWASDRPAARTCLHYAARSGSADCIDVVSTHLQARGGDQDAVKLVNKPNQSGFSPLHYAVWHEQLDALRSLSTWGAYLPARAQGTAPDTFSCNPGSTALHLAAMRGSTDITAALLHYQVVRQQQLQRQQQQQASAAHLAPPPPPVESWDTRRIPDNMCQLPFSIALTRHHYHLLHLLHPLNPLPSSPSPFPTPPPPSLDPRPSSPTPPQVPDPPLQDPLKESLLAQVSEHEAKLQQSLEPPLPDQPSTSSELSPLPSSHTLRSTSGASAGPSSSHLSADNGFFDVLAIEARLLRIGTTTCSELSDESYLSSPMEHHRPSMWDVPGGLTPLEGAGTSSRGEEAAGGVGENGAHTPGERGNGLLQGNGSGGDHATAVGLTRERVMANDAAGALARAEGSSVGIGEEGEESVEQAVEDVLQQLLGEVQAADEEGLAAADIDLYVQRAEPPDLPALLAALVSEAEPTAEDGDSRGPLGSELQGRRSGSLDMRHLPEVSVLRSIDEQEPQNDELPETSLPPLMSSASLSPSWRLHSATSAPSLRPIRLSRSLSVGSGPLSPTSAARLDPLGRLLQQQAAVTLDLCRFHRMAYGVSAAIPEPLPSSTPAADLNQQQDQNAVLIKAAAAAASVLPTKPPAARGFRGLVARFRRKPSFPPSAAPIPSLQDRGGAPITPIPDVRVKGWVHGQGDTAAVSDAATAAVATLLTEMAQRQVGAESEECACGVCLQPAGGATQLLQLGPCGHLLCGECCMELLQIIPQEVARCPFCRDPITSITPPPPPTPPPQDAQEPSPPLEPQSSNGNSASISNPPLPVPVSC